jgi:hypothetical protein
VRKDVNTTLASRGRRIPVIDLTLTHLSIFASACPEKVTAVRFAISLRIMRHFKKIQ